MGRLQIIANEIKNSGANWEDMLELYDLTPRQKSAIKQMLGVARPYKNRVPEHIKQELFEDELRIIEEKLKNKPKKPLRKVVINGKHYIDITPEFIDCGD